MTNSKNCSDSVLIVIDIINFCCHEKCELPQWGIHFTKIRRMVPKLKKFIEDYKKAHLGTVIYTSVVPWRKDRLQENINELYTANPNALYYSDDKTGFSEGFYQVVPQSDDVVVTKNQYDAFTDPALLKILKQRKIKNVIITGVFGDGCVLASVCGAFSKGFNLTIIHDLIETTDVPIRQRLQRDLKKYTWPIMYGKTVSSKEFFCL